MGQTTMDSVGRSGFVELVLGKAPLDAFPTDSFSALLKKPSFSTPMTGRTVSWRGVGGSAPLARESPQVRQPLIFLAQGPVVPPGDRGDHGRFSKK